MPAPRKFTLTLTPAEAAEITGPAGEGGHQELHKEIAQQLANGNLQVGLDDAELGRL